MSGNPCHPDVATFWLMLSERYCKGVPLLASLREIEAALPAEPMGNVAQTLADDVEGGATLSEALRSQPRTFSKAALCLVEGAEYAGIVDRVLLLIVEHMWRCPTCACWQGPGDEAAHSDG